MCDLRHVVGGIIRRVLHIRKRDGVVSKRGFPVLIVYMQVGNIRGSGLRNQVAVCC